MSLTVSTLDHDEVQLARRLQAEKVTEGIAGSMMGHYTSHALQDPARNTKAACLHSLYSTLHGHTSMHSVEQAHVLQFYRQAGLPVPLHTHAIKDALSEVIHHPLRGVSEKRVELLPAHKHSQTTQGSEISRTSFDCTCAWLPKLLCHVTAVI